MLVKLTDFPDHLAAELKSVTGESTASKACISAVTGYLEIIDLYNDLDSRYRVLQLENLRLLQVIEGARSAASLLLEQTGQGDLLV